MHRHLIGMTETKVKPSFPRPRLSCTQPIRLTCPVTWLASQQMGNLNVDHVVFTSGSRSVSLSRDCEACYGCSCIVTLQPWAWSWSIYSWASSWNPRCTGPPRGARSVSCCRSGGDWRCSRLRPRSWRTYWTSAWRGSGATSPNRWSTLMRRGCSSSSLPHPFPFLKHERSAQ